MAFFEWIASNWGSVAGIIMGLLTVASMVTRLTPSEKDDKVVAKIMAFLSFLQPKGRGSVFKPPMSRPEAPPSPFQNLRDGD